MVLFVMMLSGISLLTAMLIVYLDNQPTTREISRPIRFVFFHLLARLFCMRDDVTPTAKIACDTDSRACVEVKEKICKKESESKQDTEGSKNDEILAELRVITSFLRAQEESGAQQQEWKLLARVVDRLLFWMSLTACVVYFCTFLARAN